MAAGEYPLFVDRRCIWALLPIFLPPMEIPGSQGGLNDTNERGSGFKMASKKACLSWVFQVKWAGKLLQHSFG